VQCYGCAVWRATVGLLAWLVACGARTDIDVTGTAADAASVGEPLVDAGSAAAESDASAGGVVAHVPVDGLPACGWPANLADAGPGERGCDVGRVRLACSYPSGEYCLCESSDPTACDPDDCPGGGTCRSVCAPDHYGVACDTAPPIPAGGGHPAQMFVNQTPPAGCISDGFVSEEGESFCCPCE
jgi:hypothetical protein